jgi:hypothetical protein
MAAFLEEIVIERSRSTAFRTVPDSCGLAKPAYLLASDGIRWRGRREGYDKRKKL